MKYLLFILLFTGLSMLAQDKKIEREDRISEEKMPGRAVELINAEKPEAARRLKYYFETDANRTSYEAKFKYNGHKYSVEFDNNGKLEDIEVQLKKKEIPQITIQAIKSYIDERNERYKIEKIQAQYLPFISENQAFFNSLKPEKVSPENYELIIAVKTGGNYRGLKCCLIIPEKL
ncbi:hypothetical protein RM553_00105 [Zunongwangia sp. F363]|uniref:Uncharacterized protein n=1 Tax=Autumnicola tepida TaxID=3075595 RepID=A0ABU3C4H5_9FLAO|nr:hypothetical protein [Zunongwangia sp. F363]MDT0641219.1 hypothetical protein [Zunongwangia sp. F363]